MINKFVFLVTFIVVKGGCGKLIYNQKYFSTVLSKYSQ